MLFGPTSVTPLDNGWQWTHSLPKTIHSLREIWFQTIFSAHFQTKPTAQTAQTAQTTRWHCRAHPPPRWRSHCVPADLAALAQWSGPHRRCNWRRAPARRCRRLSWDGSDGEQTNVDIWTIWTCAELCETIMIGIFHGIFNKKMGYNWMSRLNHMWFRHILANP